jgi:hypothetical protein
VGKTIGKSAQMNIPFRVQHFAEMGTIENDVSGVIAYLFKYHQESTLFVNEG